MERLGPYPGMTKAEIIRKVFSNNERSRDINPVLDTLEVNGTLEHQVDTTTYPATMRYWIKGEMGPVQ